MNSTVSEDKPSERILVEIESALEGNRKRYAVPLSQEAEAARRPPSPALLVGAIQDRPVIPANAQAAPAKRAERVPDIKSAIAEYDKTVERVGGCADAYCYVTGKAQGMQTNGGCFCHRKEDAARIMMLAGRRLRDAIAAMMEGQHEQ